MEKQTNYSLMQTKEQETSTAAPRGRITEYWIIHAFSVHEKEMQFLEKGQFSSALRPVPQDFISLIKKKKKKNLPLSTSRWR